MNKGQHLPAAIKIRRAQPMDLPKLEALRRAKPYSPTQVHTPESCAQRGLDLLGEFLHRQDEPEDWCLLVLTVEGEPRGYLLFVLDNEHGVTHQLQAVALDYTVSCFEHLEALVTRACKVVRAFENEYLVVDLPAADKRQQLWFYRCGFRAEQHRAMRRFPPDHLGPSSPAFRTRPAGDADLPFILEIHARNSKAYLPAGRQVDMEALEMNYQLFYLTLDLSGADGSRYLIMEEVSSGAPVGYIFIQPGAVCADSLYIYDVAVAPAFANRGLSRYLIGMAETLAAQEGALLYGDATLGTPALASWHAVMGYTVDSYLYSLDCRAHYEAVDVKGM